MPYTVCFTNNSLDTHEEDILNFVRTLDIKDKIAIFKSYCYENIESLCIYDSDFHDTDYIGNYKSLPKMYGSNPINNTDIQLLNYLQNK
jgi:hypothetical protein